MNIINIEHITKRFGDKFLFEDASFGVQEGDKIGIVGINGTGKSTLLKMIAGEEEPDEGQIIRQNGKKAAYLLQNPVFCADSDIAGYALDGNPDTDEAWNSGLYGKDGRPFRRTEAKGGAGESAGRRCGYSASGRADQPSG